MRKRKQSTPNTEATLRGSSDITEQHGLEPMLSAPAETSTAPDMLVITTEGSVLHTASIPNDPILDPPNGQGPTTSTEIPTKTPYEAPHEIPRANTRPQYDKFDNSDYYKSYKRQRGIDGAIHILVATNGLQTGIPTSNFTIAPTQANIFSAFVDLPMEHVDPCLHAFLIVDNKADTLTQSHMLQDPEISKFIQAQIPELKGLQKLDVFDIKPMSQKPNGAPLLSSIWTYRRKRSPTGEILKHKARLSLRGHNSNMGGTTGKFMLQ